MADEKAQAPKAQAGPAPVRAGRAQIGEDTTGVTTTTKSPRGPGELPANAKGSERGVRALQDAVQKQADEDNERGFRGQQVDQTPNENYTLRGVGQGLPTPESQVITPKGR